MARCARDDGEISFFTGTSRGVGREWTMAALGMAKAKAESRISLWEEWNAVSVEAQG